MHTLKLSVVVACYKDQLAIPIMYVRVSKVMQLLEVDYELIFVNDGSPDHTELLLGNLVNQDSHLKAIHHSRNFGSQQAFISGMSIMTGDAVILMDGDLQDPPELIPSFYKKWMEGYDIVYGVRRDRRETVLMNFFYKLFYKVFKKISYIQIPLDSGDFSLIDRKVVIAIKALPERDIFLRGLRAWVGFRQTGVPYTRSARMFGKSTNSFFSNFNWATKGIFSFSYLPLQLMTIGSLVFFFASIIGIFAQIILKILIPGTPQGISTIIVLLLFLSSIQLLSLSILGQYIGKILEEAKGRPHYIVKHIDENK